MISQYMYVYLNRHICIQKTREEKMERSHSVLVIIISCYKKYGWLIFYSLGFSILSKFTKMA